MLEHNLLNPPYQGDFNITKLLTILTLIQIPHLQGLALLENRGSTEMSPLRGCVWRHLCLFFLSWVCV